MSVNVSIKEGGEGKVGTVDQLETPKQGGGTEIWYPKSAVQLGTKSVTQNGTYTAAADGKYGFSQFSVNVRGGNGSADSHGKPNTSSGAPEPGGAGSAVVGTDPETGNDEFVGVDSSGNLVTTPLPSSIVLVTPPTKTSYFDGESINLAGAVVVAKNADGTTWTDADHPNGHVSCSCDPAAADLSQASTGGGTVPADNPLNVPSFNFAITTPKFYWWNPKPAGNNFGYSFGGELRSALFDINNGIYPYHLQASASNNITHDAGVVNDPAELNPTELFFAIAEYTFNGKTVYYVRNNTLATWENIQTNGALNRSVNLDNYRGPAAWLMVYGDYASEAGTQTITLKWARPGDGKVLSTSFEIQVSAASSESEDNEGGGAGHSF